jgi:hypothetical protein
MNRVLLILLISIPVLFSNPGYSQRFLGALSAGINLSQVDGDEVYGFKKVGFNGGPSVIVPFGRDGKWTVTMELLFSMNGAYQKGFTDTVAPDTNQPASYSGYKLNLNYIQIPLLVHFTDKKIIAGGVGFAYGQLVSVKEWENGVRIENTTLQGPYTLADFQVLADVKLRIWKRLWANLRYSYSIFPIRTREFTNYSGKQVWVRKQHNNVITFRLTYVFNDPYIKSRDGKTRK